MSRTSTAKSRKPYERPTRSDSDGPWQHDRAPGVPSSVVNGTRTGPAAAANTKLVVSNLHYNITAKDLIAIFGQIGTLVREPHIKYDRSGRSTGTAYITYETAAEATRAKKQFDGILAKDQPMTVVYDTSPTGPRSTARRGANAPTSLMNRIQKRPLLERLTSGSDDVSKKASRPPPNVPAVLGPVRNNRGRRARSGKPAPIRKEPKTAEELDNELDAFMGDESGMSASAAVEAQPQAEGDIEMGS